MRVNIFLVCVFTFSIHFFQKCIPSENKTLHLKQGNTMCKAGETQSCCSVRKGIGRDPDL